MKKRTFVVISLLMILGVGSVFTLTINNNSAYDNYYIYLSEVAVRYDNGEITLEEANLLEDKAYQQLVEETGPINEEELIKSYEKEFLGETQYSTANPYTEE